MLGGEGDRREMLLEKILELLEGLPDKEDAMMPEGEGKLEVIGVEAKPMDEKDKAVC